MSEGSIAIAERIAARREDLSPSERRVAAVVVDHPQLVAFGTVARVAAEAGTSGASVVRLAAKLDYSGFAEMQAAVQRAIGQQLRPAAERIRGTSAHAQPDVVARTLQAELDNVEQTLGAVDPEIFAASTALLAAKGRVVRILGGDAVEGIAAHFAASLALLRPHVAAVSGSDVTVARQLATAAAEGELVVVPIDLRRYERWVVDAARRAAAEGAAIVAITDSVLSPLAALTTLCFTVRAEGAGPFDSQVGTLALTNALVSGVAGRLRRTATPRLAAVESAWNEADALLEP
jgi:DNA-binding MurR/RpiR family transcriptional regulator